MKNDYALELIERILDLDGNLKKRQSLEDPDISVLTWHIEDLNSNIEACLNKVARIQELQKNGSCHIAMGDLTKEEYLEMIKFQPSKLSLKEKDPY